MLDEDLAESVLDAATGHNPMLAEVRIEERLVRQVALKSGEVNSVNSSRDAGMNVRIVLPTGIGFAASNTVSRSEGLRLVRDALAQAKGARRSAPVHLSDEAAVRTKWEVSQRVRLADVALEEKISRLREIDSSVVSTKVKVQGRYYDLVDWELSSLFVN